MAVMGYRAEMDAGRRFLQSITPGENIVLLFHGDADGCCSGAIMYRTLRHMGNQMIFPVFMEKGESLYSDTLANRVLIRDPSRLIVMDMGSRMRPIIPGVTTMVIDHHYTEGVPPVDVFITSYGIDPPAPASLLTYEICKDLAQLGGLEWIAAVGASADLGADADFEVLRNARSLYGEKNIKETVALINAARRSPSHDIKSAFSALTESDSPLDIVEGTVAASSALAGYREEVNAEFKQAVRTAPKINGQWALIPFCNEALIHPLVAVAWTRRLKNNIVIAANYGYTRGNVHFSVRTALDVNLIDALKSAHSPEQDCEFAHGHPQATGGIMTCAQFANFLNSLGFPPEEMAQAV
ncbi:MAG: DHH family phosphoesterase [Armatimonadota bacterium]